MIMSVATFKNYVTLPLLHYVVYMIVVIGKAYTCKHKIFDKPKNLCNTFFSQTAESLIIAALRSKVFIWSCHKQNKMKDKHTTLIEQFQNPIKINRRKRQNVYPSIKIHDC